MVRNVLYCTDGSDNATSVREAAFWWLRVYPAACLTVLYVSDEMPNIYGLQPEIYYHYENQMADEIHARTVLTAPADIAHRVVFRHEHGHPAAVICDVAQEIKADVVVLGSHGRGFLDRVVLGSVSQEVLRRSDLPVQVVPLSTAGGNFAIRRILFATDAAPGTRQAELFLRRLLSDLPDLEVVTLYVQNVARYGPYSGFLEDIYPMEAERADAVRREMTDVFAEVQDRHRFITVKGHPVQAITEVAQSTDANLIVLGAHGHSRSERWILGSVGEGVVHRAVCPVLIVKDTPAAARITSTDV